MEIYLVLIVALVLITLIFSILSMVFALKKDDSKEELSSLRQELSNTTINAVNTMGEAISRNESERLLSLEERFKTFSIENEQKLENIRKSVEDRLIYLQEDNNKQLEKMRMTVDEKLQESLENKLSESFKTVSEQLAKVYSGLGEMKELANGVGDLKKVLSNVKTRGILGEVQLGAILSEILSKEQYDENVITKKSSSDRVEFAIKLPSKDDSFIYLPIDSKFPLDTYSNLRNAYDTGDKDNVESAWKMLRTTILSEAKDISSKYIDIPNTTEFAIMFLPFEGLYSEVVNRGMVEELQNKYKINVAGPSTMAALLNSIQMGFKTLAVEKRSAEVWKILGGVKKEFENFHDVLITTQNRLDKVQEELDTLIGKRTNKIIKELKSVEILDSNTENSFDVGDN